MRLYKLISIYLFFYYLFGTLVFLAIFGFANSVHILQTAPMSTNLSGCTILLASLLASIIIISLMKKRLAAQPYPYFMLGFYIGNLSLLFMFLLDALLKNYVIWKFPEFLLIFVAPFMELFLSYLFAFAFMALIPSWLSAYILFKTMQYITKHSSTVDVQ